MPLNVWTVAPDQPFLRVLATAVAQGFPLDSGADRPPLSQWTILVPTRRAARALEQAVHDAAPTRATLLPRIRPIGDIDEDALADQALADDVADAISPAGQLHLLLTLVTRWAQANSGLPLAADVLASGSQAFNLALSLQDLLNQMETEEAGFAALAEAMTLDLAGHGAAILGLLHVLATELPEQLATSGLMGPAARRNLMIRREAVRIASGAQRGPVIAAGSTGTNPATRALLMAIAARPDGAVVLPGLDLALDDDAWAAITPEHPQAAMKTMLAGWTLPRAAVRVLGAADGARVELVRLALRPAEAADGWPQAIAAARPQLSAARNGLQLVETKDREEEALTIALRLRQHVAESTTPAALITPDRDLARRVAVELARWNLDIDDSAGEPLSRLGVARLLVLLLDAIAAGFNPPSLLALASLPDCTLGLAPADKARALQIFEITCLRGMPAPDSLADLPRMVAAAHAAQSQERHLHPLVAAVTAEDWALVESLVQRLVAVLAPFQHDPAESLDWHIARLQTALAALAPEAGDDDVSFRLQEILDGLRAASRWHPVTTLERAQHGLRHHLDRDMVRPLRSGTSQLAIYGLLEARMMEAGLVVLGGLQEGGWPAAAHSGPWFNRPTRQVMGLAQPERDIGLTAHDFTQALAQPQIMVTWPRRVAGEPVLPSRWITRLRAVLEALDVPAARQLDHTLPQLARRLDAPGHFQPRPRPQARPPVALRPRRFSVTEVEKLVRDSYSIHARRVLGLSPLPGLSEDLNMALRGTLIHAALAAWSREIHTVPASESLALLVAKGRAAFAPYMHLPEVARFWWTRFERMARVMVEIEHELAQGRQGVVVETGGAMPFDVAGVEHVLSARADRMDVMADGMVRLVDYKSGAPPSVKQVQSGFAPQLVLEATLVSHGAFPALAGTPGVSDAVYIHVGGGKEAAKLHSLAEIDVMAQSREQFEHLVRLLTQYQDSGTAYIPRHNLFMEDEATDYDHLSRRLEWQLATRAGPA